MNNAPYFATQEITDVNCVVLAINNLFGEPIITRNSLLGMKGKNRKNRNQNICEEHGRGLVCQNKIIEHILKLIQTEKLRVSKPIQTFFQNTTAVTWYDLRKQTLNNDFDIFFKKFHKHIIGIYGNRSFTAGIGHAVCVRRSVNGRNLWLLDSLNKERKRVSLTYLPVDTHKLQPFVVILKNTYFEPPTLIYLSSNSN
jgi:hypothetical protein